MLPAERRDPSNAETAYLAGALSISRAVIGIEKALTGGNEAEGRACLSLLAENVAIGLPGLERVVAAKLQTAEAQHRTEGTVARVLRLSAEHPNTPANDHDPALHSPRPQSPA